MPGTMMVQCLCQTTAPRIGPTLMAKLGRCMCQTRNLRQTRRREGTRIILKYSLSSKADAMSGVVIFVALGSEDGIALWIPLSGQKREMKGSEELAAALRTPI
mmetsp:Transcript_45707/g.138897  ORF Transcript_45707/g.138897 Transcript_45707/m.138897 type:complete len:103 (+) Transcript_45707:4044-4352(+)